MLATYLVIIVMFLGPVAAGRFVEFFVPTSPAAEVVQASEVMSPFSAVFNLPLEVEDQPTPRVVDVRIFWGHLVFAVVYNLGLLLSMIWLFKVRWRVTD